MNNQQISKISQQLADHEKRICRLEGVADENPSNNLEIKTNETQKVSPKSKGDNLLPPVQKLIQDGYLKEWRSDVEVCQNLSMKLLTKKKPLRSSVANVLRAMVKKGILTRNKIQRDKREILVYKQT